MRDQKLCHDASGRDASFALKSHHSVARQLSPLVPWSVSARQQRMALGVAIAKMVAGLDLEKGKGLTPMERLFVSPSRPSHVEFNAVRIQWRPSGRSRRKVTGRDERSWQEMDRKQRRELTRRIQAEDLSLEVVHPDAAGVDIGNESHYVAVPPAGSANRCGASGAPPRS